MDAFPCSRCNDSFSLSSALKRHCKECRTQLLAFGCTDLAHIDSDAKSYPCSHCDKFFSRAENRKRHERSQHRTATNNESAPLCIPHSRRRQMSHISKKKPCKSCNRCRERKLKC